MTGKTSTDSSSVLPPDARTARIAADGGLFASLQDLPGRKNEARDGDYDVIGFELDDLDFVAPRAADSRNELSVSVPDRSFQTVPILSRNPT